MGRAGLGAALTLLVSAALLPAATSGSVLEDCTTIRYSILPTLGGAVRLCPKDLEYEIGGMIPELPGVPGGDDEAIDFVASSCPDGNGVNIAVNGKSSFVCLGLAVEPPSDVETPGLDGETQTEECPPGSAGLVLRRGETAVGLCVIMTFEAPSGTEPDPFVDASNKHCQNGADPAVGAFGAVLAICIVTVVRIGPAEPGDPPPIGVDLSPCSPHGVDPSVTVGDGGVFICVEFNVDP